jgi:hypothetical protein
MDGWMAQWLDSLTARLLDGWMAQELDGPMTQWLDNSNGLTT